MPDTNAAESQADEAQQPQAGNAESQADEARETISTEEAKKLRSEAASLRRRAKEAEAELEKIRTDQMSEQERAIADARMEERTAALKVANQRIVAAEIKTAAVGKITNPELAVHLIPADKFEVADDGSIDAEAVAAAIDELIQKYPELGQRPVIGSVDGGVRPAPQSKMDMSELLRRAARG